MSFGPPAHPATPPAAALLLHHKGEVKCSVTLQQGTAAEAGRSLYTVDIPGREKHPESAPLGPFPTSSVRGVRISSKKHPFFRDRTRDLQIPKNDESSTAYSLTLFQLS